MSYSFCEDSLSSSSISTPSPSIRETLLVPVETPFNVQKQRNKKRKKDLEQEALLNRCLGVMSKPADSFEIFGDYIADELRNMNSKAPDLQSQAKRKIQRIVLEMNDLYDSRMCAVHNIQSSVPLENQMYEPAPQQSITGQVVAQQANSERNAQLPINMIAEYGTEIVLVDNDEAIGQISLAGQSKAPQRNAKIFYEGSEEFLAL